MHISTMALKQEAKALILTFLSENHASFVCRLTCNHRVVRCTSLHLQVCYAEDD